LLAALPVAGDCRCVDADERLRDIAIVEAYRRRTALLPYLLLPPIDLLLRALRINRERLDGTSRIAVDAKLLRALLQVAAGCQPFDEAFYLETYPDIAAAHAKGDIPDLHRHYVETGYFEGRAGAPTVVDEDYYAQTYHDVGMAVRRGDVKSGAEHFLRSGAAEGRVPNPDLKPAIDWWAAVLR
jgi:hypothetical protein